MKKQIMTAGVRISPATQIDDSYDLKLLSEDEIKHANYSHVSSKEILIQSAIKPGQNFFYSIEQYDCNKQNSKLLKKEIGVGEIKKIRRAYYLSREICLQFFDGNSNYPVYRSKFYKFTEKDCPLYVTSVTPENYIECLAYENSVLCSINPFSPSPVELQENTLLGRIDGMIQSIDSEELRKILTDEQIVSAVSTYRGPLTLFCSSLDIPGQDSSVSSALFHSKPSQLPKNPKRGYISYDGDENSMKVFDGERWRRLLWE